MTETISKPVRLESLDALRGFDMLWIIGGGGVIQALGKVSDSVFLKTLGTQLTHVAWEGLRFGDLIMPLFLFMVGMSIPFSLGKRLTLGESKKKIYLHTFKRWAILFTLGMFYEGNLLALDVHNLFVGSVLGAIGIGYFFSTIIYTRLKLKIQILLTAGLLLTYWAILTFVPVPGQQAGILLPASNITKYFEEIVFGRFAKTGVAYMWFLDTLGFVSTVMTGVFAGTILRENFSLKIIRSSNAQIHKTLMLVLIGILLVCISLILNTWFPMIKNIWTPTYVLFTAGLCFLLMALFYYVIDVKGFKRWAFWLKVIGMNSIAVYLGTRFIPFDKIAHGLVFGLEQFFGVYYPAFQSLAGLAIIYGIMYWMYKKGTFIKI